MIICKCCGKEARWCGDDPENKHNCDHIHCDHCKMHYSLEGHDENTEADTFEQGREIMLRVYNVQAKGQAMIHQPVPLERRG